MASRNDKGPVFPLVKKAADRIGIGGLLRQAYVEVSRLGERAQTLLPQPPAARATILLIGSGRSGTTWMTEALTHHTGVQAIFEPMLPLWNGEVRRLTGWDKSDPHVRSFYLRADGHYPEWHALLARILRGQYRNYWTDKERTAFFPSRFLVKEIRMNLMSGYIYRHFQPAILYLVRHPCAVVASRLHLGWHADVQDILRQEELVEEVLSPWVREIEKERDLLGAQAVWWAVENHVAMKQLAPHPHLLVTFEEAYVYPEVQARRIFDFVQVAMPAGLQERMKIPSRMSTANSPSLASGDRLSAWQRHLSRADQQRVLSWAQRMGWERYTDASMPMPLSTETD